MTKINRATQKIFGINAEKDDIAVMGSFKSGTPIYTDDIEKLQNTAFEEGYASALVANEAPFMEEQNSVPYVLSKQLAYLFQEGIPEYDENTTYYTNSICKVANKLYVSKTDDNLGNNPTESGDNWEELSTNGGGDTLPLGWSTYQSGGTPSSAFLASLGQQNSGTLYPTFYNEFSAKIGQAFGAGFVKAHTASDITDYDLVINPDEQTFRLPLKNGKENLVGDEYIQINTLPANDETLTAPANGYYTISVFASATTSRFYMTNLSDNLTVGEGGATLSNVSWNYVMPCKKGDKIQFHYESIIIQNDIFYFCPNIGNGTLYYKVSNAVQNLQLLDVAEMTTALANKVDSTNTQWAVSACMPDYTAGVSITLGQKFTAPVGGCVYAQGESLSGGNGVFITLYQPDGTQIKKFPIAVGEGTQTIVRSTCLFIIPKKYSCTVTGGQNQNIVFYPMEGAK